MNAHITSHSPKGSVLIITLIILFMLTMLAVVEMSMNTTQTRIATNSADAQIAFQTAEGALNQATNDLLAGTYSTSSFFSNANGLYIANPSNPPLWTTVDWTSSAVITSFQGSSNLPARYIIEQLPSIINSGQNMSSPTLVYRITVRATGPSGGSITMLQATVQIQL